MTEAKQARWSLAIAAVTLTIQNGIVMAFGVLYLPLVGEFGGSRAWVAAVQSVVFIFGGFSGPLIGYALDRVGPRRLFQGGALLAAAGLAAASLVESLPLLFLTYGFTAGLGLAALGSQPNMVVAALWYPRARGRAIALADLGTGFGAFVFVPVAQTLVALYGWRTTLLVWTVLLIGLVIPANAFQRLPSNEEEPVRPDPIASPNSDVDAQWTLGRAVRTSGFWWLTLLRFLSGLSFPLMNVHMVAFAVGAGVSPMAAAGALGSVSLVSLAGRLMTGWLADRLGRALTLTLTYGSAATGIMFLSFLTFKGWPGWLVAYVVFYGMAQGSSGIVSSARAADLFAGRAFGMIYGWIVLATGPGEALGVWAGGAIYDLTGSYLWAFAVVVAGLGLGVCTIWRVRPIGDPRTARSDDRPGP
jgi:MFS family permease